MNFEGRPNSKNELYGMLDIDRKTYKSQEYGEDLKESAGFVFSGKQTLRHSLAFGMFIGHDLVLNTKQDGQRERSNFSVGCTASAHPGAQGAHRGITSWDEPLCPTVTGYGPPLKGVT